MVYSAASIGFALYAENVWGLQPCILCTWQRYTIATVFPVALLGIIFSFLYRWFLGICAILFFATAAIAFYQVGIEEGIIQPPRICETPSFEADNVESLKAALMKIKPTSCKEVQWRLFGISMAGYNGLLNILMVFITLFFLRQKKRYKTKPKNPRL
jgi:disulfide bond formation protein DsbB